MSEIINTEATHYHVAVRVANGGYICYGLTHEDGGISSEVFVTSDLENLLVIVARLLKGMEGSDGYDSIGPLRVEGQ